MELQQADYRANPSLVGDVAQGVDSYEEPNAAPAVGISLPSPPDPDTIDDERPMIDPKGYPSSGYVQEGLALDLPRSVSEQWAEYNRDVGKKGYTSW